MPFKSVILTSCSLCRRLVSQISYEMNTSVISSISWCRKFLYCSVNQESGIYEAEKKKKKKKKKTTKNKKKQKTNKQTNKKQNKTKSNQKQKLYAYIAHFECSDYFSHVVFTLGKSSNRSPGNFIILANLSDIQKLFLFQRTVLYIRSNFSNYHCDPSINPVSEAKKDGYSYFVNSY